MSDKAAARQYAVRNKKIFNMRNPEYIPEPTGASNTSTGGVNFITSSENSAADTTANSDTKMLEDTEARAAATAVVLCYLQGLIQQGIISEGLTETAEDFLCSYFAPRKGDAVEELMCSMCHEVSLEDKIISVQKQSPEVSQAVSLEDKISPGPNEDKISPVPKQSSEVSLEGRCIGTEPKYRTLSQRKRSRRKKNHAEGCHDEKITVPETIIQHAEMNAALTVDFKPILSQGQRLTLKRRIQQQQPR